MCFLIFSLLRSACVVLELYERCVVLNCTHRIAKFSIKFYSPKIHNDKIKIKPQPLPMTAWGWLWPIITYKEPPVGGSKEARHDLDPV